jgi:hypothetical protein
MSPPPNPSPAWESDAIPMAKKHFHYNFSKHLTAEGLKVLWQTYSVPVIARIFW